MLDDTSDPLALARIAQHKAIRRRRHAARRKTATSTSTPPDVPRLSPTQRQGSKAEDRAAAHVQGAGARILGRNLLCRAGEIDLVCLDGTVLAFIEVRHRHNARFGGAAASVDHVKRQRLARAASYFLPRLAQRYFNGRTPRCRFDVIAIEGMDLSWLKGAFEAMR